MLPPAIAIIRRRFISATAVMMLFTPAMALAAESSGAGRWDATIEIGRARFPAWFELTNSSSGPSLVLQPPAGGPEHLGKVDCADNRLAFSSPTLGTLEGRFDGDRFVGSGWNGRDSVRMSAVRAPELSDAPVTWGKPERLFDGRSLTGWHYRWDRGGIWRVRNGALVSAWRNDDLVTDRQYMNFKLHLKYMLQELQDSGVHLRGRYEIQLSDAVTSADADESRSGAVYGHQAPLVHAQRGPGKWNTLDVELVGRRLTARLNGRLIHDRIRIPGITGDALDSNEGEPGPIMLQGHLGLVKFRDIVITPAR